jgi:hypothetical protein
MKYILLALLLPLLVLLAACGDDDDDDGGPTATESTAPATDTEGPTDTVAPTPTETESPEPTLLDVCPDNPDPATEEQVVVDSPAPGDSSQSPLVVTGVIAAFEAQFNIRILDADSNAIVDGFSDMSSEGQTLAPFESEVPFTVTEETPACLEVYMISPNDGADIDIYQVPVTLLP